VTRDQWYKWQHDRRLVRRQWRLLQEGARRWAEEMAATFRRAYRAVEPVMLAYERKHLIETLAKVRDRHA